MSGTGSTATMPSSSSESRSERCCGSLVLILHVSQILSSPCGVPLLLRLVARFHLLLALAGSQRCPNARGSLRPASEL